MCVPPARAQLNIIPPYGSSLRIGLWQIPVAQPNVVLLVIQRRQSRSRMSLIF